MATLNLKRLTKVYDHTVVAVKDVDVDIKDREFVVLVGPSGCGKTTTLRMIAGLEDISSGELMIDGRLVNDIPPKDRDIAMVFQNYALYPHMTVYDNMAFGLKIRKFNKEEIEKRVGDAAKILELQSLLRRKPKQLSGGQRQRVAVGRAIVRKPKVFLFDEPLSNLDAKLRVQMRTEISDLHNRLQATMIYVTHDQVEAMTMGDKIVVMRDGEVQQIGDPLSLYNEPVNRFVAGFIGSPPMNFLTVSAKVSGNKLSLTQGNEVNLELGATFAKIASDFDGRQLIFGIRPERLEYGDSAKEGEYLNATVEIIEPLGAETHLYVQVGTQKMVARVNPNVPHKPGDKIRLKINPAHVTLFDPKSELAL